jgi:hypothetical protein
MAQGMALDIMVQGIITVLTMADTGITATDITTKN